MRTWGLVYLKILGLGHHEEPKDDSNTIKDGVWWGREREEKREILSPGWHGLSYWIKSLLKLELFLNIWDFSAKTFFPLASFNWVLNWIFYWVTCNLKNLDWHAILPANIYGVTAIGQFLYPTWWSWVLPTVKLKFIGKGRQLHKQWQ